MEYVYESRYSDEKARPDGYLVEVFMTRKYKRKNQILPYKFWNSPKYKSEFFANLSTVRGIFKTYKDRGISEKTIVVALTRPEAEKISWLKDERIDSLIEKQIELEKNSESAKIDTSDCSEAQPGKKYNKKRSTLSILREAESE